MNVHTEKTAKEMFCPHIEGGIARCVGSACMAWRWSPPFYEDLFQTDRPKGDGWEQMSETHWQRGFKRLTAGYCGLAGRP